METKNKSKISVAMVTNNFEINGISTVIINYCKNINLEEFDIDIIAGDPVAKEYKQICSELGIKVIHLPQRKLSPLAYYKALFFTLKKKKYDIVHIHGNSSTITVELLLSKFAGIKKRIAHSHNSTCEQMTIHRLLYPLFSILYTDGFACSELAGKWLFRKKKFTVIRNGFETEKFAFDESIRTRKREELGISDKFVLGHIGRMNNQKNQRFLLNLFAEYGEKNEQAVLLLVGVGPDFENIKELVKSHPYEDRVILYGESENAEELYQCFDLFLFPSKYEGLGIVALEAQISGLGCIVSNAVPKDVDISGNILFLNLEIDVWIAGINEFANRHRNGCIDRRKLYDNNFSKIATYDIRKNARDLENLYKRILGRK